MHATMPLPVAEAPAPAAEAVAITERGHQTLTLFRCQDGLPSSSWLSDYIAAELDRRIVHLLDDDGD